MVDVQAPDKYKSKLKLSKGSSSTQGSSADSSYHTTTQGKPWIIYSGTTNHMTGASK